jgi:hypothetical protein
MCRWLIVRSAEAFDPGPLFRAFAEMARLSRAPDGDRQADGWGLAWSDGSGEWRTRKSLKPVWEDESARMEVPETRLFAVHARSASFPDQKDVIEYNQPFVAGSRAFVFNGMIQGVSFPRPLEGWIGAQKIWSLLKPEARRSRIEEVLGTGVREIETNARKIQALNIGLIEEDRIAVYCHGADDLPYYRLQAAVYGGTVAVCSEPLSGLPFRPLPARTVIVL